MTESSARLDPAGGTGQQPRRSWAWIIVPMVISLWFAPMLSHDFGSDWASKLDAEVVERMAEELKRLRQEEPGLSSLVLEARIKARFRRPLCGDKTWHFHWFPLENRWEAAIEFGNDYPSATYYTWREEWDWDT